MRMRTRMTTVGSRAQDTQLLSLALALCCDADPLCFQLLSTCR